MNKKNVADFYPLSPMQEGMLFHSLLAPESGVYVEQVQCTLRGSLEVLAFERAWQQVMTRHAILRTSFIGKKLKEPVQVVHRNVPVPLIVLDWRALSREEQVSKLSELVSSERQQGFALSKAPLMRLTLAQTADDVYEFLWTYHHILMDGWSQPLLYREMFALYEAYVREKTLPLPEPLPYRDYIVWLKKQDMAVSETFWKENLKGFIAPTPLVTGRSESAVADQPEKYGEAEVNLLPETTTALRDLARQLGVTLNILVQGAWAILLSRYSGERDVVFGVTVSGRPVDLAGAEFMIGLFINTLPLRTLVSERSILGDWLKDLQKQQAELLQYQYTPLVQVQGWSDVPRDQPLFESILVFENYPTGVGQPSQALSLQIDNVQSVEQTNYPLTAVAGAADTLMLKLAYDVRRFESETIHRMLGHWMTLLKGMLVSADKQLVALPLLMGEEEQQLLVEWQPPVPGYAVDRCVHKLFEEQVARTPAATALVFGDNTLTYEVLNHKANQLAHYLQSRGVGPESLVGIYVDRSFEMIISILGVLKAGGAYLPLDPTYPAERLRFMIEDSHASLLLAQEHLVGQIPGHSLPVILIGETLAHMGTDIIDNPHSDVTLDNLAYVIYTSGSTGRPKGTLLQHRGLANFVLELPPVFDIHSDSRVLQFSSLGFDASIADIFPTLLVGAALHLMSHDVLLSETKLLDFLRHQQITIAFMPPSMLRLLPAEDLPDLKVIISAGEQCSLEVAERWSPGRRFINGYGPTETTVAASYFVLDPSTTLQERVPIGCPLHNTQLYVLDSYMRPVPVLVPGELYVGGISLARGYLDRPGLTAERFVPNPFSSTQGGRLYRTGDLVRYLPDGNLDFLGRIDHQVKVRGFRIELGEIENVLEGYPGLRQAVVLAREDTPGNKRLIAYLVPDKGVEVDVNEIRLTISKQLPDYMVPSSFVVMAEFPLTTSGKVNRKALPVPELSNQRPTDTFIGPRDRLELQLVTIWEDILEVHPIGVKDNFFELGGHSLLAMRLIAVIQQELGVDVPIMALLQDPTVERLAGVIRRQDGLDASATLVPIQPKGDTAPLFFIHPSGGSVHWYADLARHLGKKQPFYGLQARGLYGNAEIHTRIEDMATYYIEAITEKQPEGPYFLGSWSLGVVIAFEMARQLTLAGREVGLLALLDQGPALPVDEPGDDAEYLFETFGKHVPPDLEALRQLDPQAQMAFVWEKARAVDWLYPDVTLAQFSHFVRMLRTQTEAWRSYVIKPYRGRITLFRARRQAGDEPLPPDLGWGAYALDGVEVIDVPGDHLTMIHNPYVFILARKLRKALEQAQLKLDSQG